MKKIIITMFILIAMLSIGTVSCAATFKDTVGTKYEAVVERLYHLDVINGVTKTTFEPTKKVTRAEMAKMLVIAHGFDKGVGNEENQFKDVKTTHWAHEYVSIAANRGLIKGYEDGTFKPEKEVSYAEVVAVILRSLGHSYIKENSPYGWEYEYIIKMREIKLNEGISAFANTDTAIRGNVALFIWNMLKSNKWEVASDNETTGFTYRDSGKSLMSLYFKDYKVVSNQSILSIENLDGEFALDIDDYDLVVTEDVIPFSAIGSTIEALYDVEQELLIGIQYQVDKVIEGNLKKLQEDGYEVKKYNGNKYYVGGNSGKYAYVALENDKIERVVLVDGSNSRVIESIKKITTKEKEEDTGETITTVEYKINDEFMVGEEAIVLYREEKINWEDVKEGGVLTTVINKKLYAYETYREDGEFEDLITHDNTKYMTLSGSELAAIKNAEYTLPGSITLHRLSDITDSKLKELKGRKAKCYFNFLDEVVKIEFGVAANEENVSVGDFSVYYVAGNITTGGPDGKDIRYIELATEKGKKKYQIAKTINVAGIAEGYFVSAVIKNDRVIESMSLLKDAGKVNGLVAKIDYKSKPYLNGAFGEYKVTEDTIIYKITTTYKVNTSSIENSSIEFISDFSILEDLEGQKVSFLYNTENKKIQCIFLVNNTDAYDVIYAKVNEIQKEKETKKVNGKLVTVVQYYAQVTPFGSVISVYPIEEGECKEGDLISYVKEEKDEITIKEVYDREFIGYEKDLIISSISKNGKLIKFENSEFVFDLEKETFQLAEGGKIYRYDRYKYIRTTVNKRAGYWKFVAGEILNKIEDISFKVGDRIAVNELDGVVVVYRGYTD